ncbi:hypothetical protein KFE25_006255 [Diacronema lutheri]|uniref:Glycosyltransferase 2-like domain-containing protein n=2 Tax=Diacronema lutheri TaxID=2081491 RepID=A0A8J5XXM6_DIALT|nr:hypothetical protein KFE25_006255 [Diacronema lutheri]
MAARRPPPGHVVISLAALLLLAREAHALAANARPNPSGLRISLLVPCTPAHFGPLNRTLSAYAAGVVHPDEVIVSLSGSADGRARVARSRVERLRGTFARVFSRVVLLEHAGERSAGENRNAAGAHASGDVLVFSDADDVPHPQRLAVLAHWFAKEPAVQMLHHTWVRSTASFRPWTERELGAVRRVSPGELARAFDVHCAERYPPVVARAMVSRTRSRLLAPEMLTQMPVFQPLRTAAPIHTGNLALRREVLARVRWPTFREAGEDKAFSWSVVAQLRAAIVIEVPLVCYCESRLAAACSSACAPVGVGIDSVDVSRWPTLGR